MYDTKPLNAFDKHLLSSCLISVNSIEELHKIEQKFTTIKTKELLQNPIKGNFDYAHLKAIHRYIFEDIYSWAGLDRYEINLLGTFRKGNGRVQRIFVEMLAQNAGFDLNLSVVSKDVMIQASIQGAKGNPKGFEVIIRQNIKEQYERK